MDAIQYRTHHLSDEDADRVGTLEQLSEQRQQRLEQLKRETFARQCEIASSSYSSSSGDQIPLPK